jgi:hypothetical protein
VNVVTSSGEKFNRGKTAYDRNLTLSSEGLHESKTLMLPLEGLHMKHAVQRGV